MEILTIFYFVQNKNFQILVFIYRYSICLNKCILRDACSNGMKIIFNVSLIMACTKFKIKKKVRVNGIIAYTKRFSIP